MAWDVIMPDTYADSHLTVTSSAVRSAASEAVTHKTAKYVSTASIHHLMPMAIETSGVFDNEAEEFIQQVGHRCRYTEMTVDPKETNTLFLKISIAIHRQCNRIPWYIPLHRNFRKCFYQF